MKKNNLLNEGRFIDSAIVYVIAKKFILPFKKWKAFKLGLITDKGKRTKKKPRSREEKNSYTLLDRLVRKIRVIMGDSKFLRLSLGYLLLRDSHNDFPSYTTLLLEEQNNTIRKEIDIGNAESINIMYEDRINEFDFFMLTTLSDKITSQFGSTNIPKRGNENFLDDLDNIFSNIFNSGYEEVIVKSKERGETFSNINYSPTEMSIETFPQSEKSLTLGKFYVIMQSKDITERFLNTWEEFMGEVR